MKKTPEDLRMSQLYDLHKNPRLMQKNDKIYFHKNILLLFHDVRLFYAHKIIQLMFHEIPNLMFHKYILLCCRNDIIDHQKMWYYLQASLLH